MRFTLLFSLCMIIPPSCSLAAVTIPTNVDPALIVNYRFLRPGVATAGRVLPDGMAQLKALGFKTILDIRTQREGVSEEEAAVRALGLRYVNVPITPETLSVADLDVIERLLDDKDAAPVLFHCGSANRVGGVWALLSMRRGKSPDEAQAEGRAIGLKSPAMIEAVKRLSPLLKR
jgi:uncharacterized protein (TIGR01244 family)